VLRKIKQLLQKNKDSAFMTSEKISALFEMLLKTEPGEISYEDVGAALGEFAEMHQRGEDVKHLMPLVYKHLELCQDCREEYEALLAALEAETML
jgi:hypothetical protein